MFVINVRNVHDALPEGLRQLQVHGVQRDSRNGPVLVMPGPTTTLYQKPRERVMFHPSRDANPFFHFVEGLWMLAGRNDVAFVAGYVKRMASFSDDGVTLHGAYGHRWRRHFGFDQLGHIVEALKENPEDRRNVLGMWDTKSDLGRRGKDLPCNTQAYFTRNGSGALDMTVCCRSNDAIWGAYGANAVHFSMLQEYMALAIGCEVGRYWQMSNNFHAYLDTFTPLEHLVEESGDPYLVSDNPYDSESLTPYPMMSTPAADWQSDLGMFLQHGMTLGIRDPFFRKVANPIFEAHKIYKAGGVHRFQDADTALTQCAAGDWRLACKEWVMRRETEHLDKGEDS